MPTSSGSTKPAKPSREEKKAARTAKRTSRRETWQNMRQAFTLTRQNDPRFIPYLILCGLGAAALAFVIVFLITGKALYAIPIAVAAGLVGALLLFSRRAQRSMYAKAEGQPGAAGWLLEQQLRGDWKVRTAVAGTAQLDAVHRLVGQPGIVLIGEGSPQRVRGLLAQEKRKIARVAGDTPIYDIVVGTADGEVPLGKLQRQLIKLPRNLSKDQVAAVEKRLSALGGARAPLPQGPMPQGAKMRNVQRTVRRRS